MSAGTELPRIDETSVPVGASVAGAVDRILAGELCGIVVRHVIDPAEAAALVADLRGGAAGPREQPSRYYRGASYGSILAVADAGDMPAYFGAARDVNAWLTGSVASTVGLQDRLVSTLAALCAPRQLEAPAGEPDAYARATVRRYDPGSEIPVHSEKVWPTMRALARQVDFRQQLSFYLLLQAPERGGVLTVYGRPSGASGLEAPKLDPDKLDAVLAQLGSVEVALAAGDLVVFHGGRHNHRVTPIEGALARWTLGGFLALSVDQTRILYWS